MARARQPHPQVALGLEPGPFHDRVAAFNHQQAWTNWLGFASATVLDTVEFEYFAIRNQATLYDISPMCKYEIAGPDAERVVNRLVTRDIGKLSPGRVIYAIWCDEDGNVVDDGTVFRLAADRFMLCCQEPQLAWLDDIAWGFDVAVRDISRELAGLALQGPTSYAILNDLELEGIGSLKPFAIGNFRIGGAAVTISRTGFTGDLGYEIWIDPKDAGKVWDRLMEAGRLHGLRPVGYAAVDMARIEAGFLLPRVDFLSSQGAVRTGRARNPFELGMDWLVDLAKPHFNGRRALLALKGRKPSRQLVMIEIDRNKPAVNALIYHRKKREAGFVTSALWSPTVKRNIAFAWLDAPHGEGSGDDLWVEIYLQKELQWERRMERCRIIGRGVFSHPRRTATPPGMF